MSVKNVFGIIVFLMIVVFEILLIHSGNYLFGLAMLSSVYGLIVGLRLEGVPWFYGDS